MWGLKRASLGLAAAFALVISATPAAAQAGASWAPNEDDAVFFEARLGQYRLGEGIRGYQTPQGVCLNLPDVVLALDIPIEIDKQNQIAQGWAFDERNQMRIDRRAGKVRIGDRQASLEATEVRDTPEGWCVAAKSLTSWLGIEFVVDLSSAVVTLKSKAKLPVELAAERRSRAARVRPSEQVDLSKLPQARLPYRMWRTPSLDAVVTVGGLSDKQQGKRFDRQYDLYVSGEVAAMSFDSRLASDQKGAPSRFRMRAYRSDVNGGLLGPLRATHFEVGDVSSFSSPMVVQTMPGRGAMVTNRPLDHPDTFDKKTFRGELPVGWDAELYRSGQLLAVAQNRADGRYEFIDIPLLFGQNRIEIVLYGPQGQIRRSSETITVGAESIPPKKTWYWAGVSQDQKDLVYWRDPGGGDHEWRATLGIERGIDTRTSFAAQVHSLVLEDERLTFVEGAARRSIGSALVEVGAAYTISGGVAGRAQLLGQFGNTNISSETIVARNFRSDRIERDVMISQELALDHTFDLGKIALPAHAEARYVQRRNGASSLEGQARVSTTIDRISITGLVDWILQRESRGPDPPTRLDAALLANGTVGKTRLRGEVRWQLSPDSRFSSAAVVAERPLGHNASLRGEIGYDQGLDRVRGSLGYVRQFNKFALSVTGEAATDGSMAAGLNLAFSLGPDPRGGMRVTSQKLAANGSVLARVFRDENGDGIRAPGEAYEKDVQILVGRRPIEQVTNERGEVIIDGLEPHLPVLIGVDASSLPDPLVQPASLGLSVTPRRGIPMTIDLPIVGAGEILGTLVTSSARTVEGVDVELVKENGLVVATARTDLDGFFLFESVAYGNYQLRLSKPSAAVIDVSPNLGISATVGPNRPSVRLGNVTAGGAAPYRLAYQQVLMEGPLAQLVLAR